MTRALTVAAWIAPLLLGSFCVRAAEVHYAIVVGNNEPPRSDPGLAVLRYADDDAVRIFSFVSRFAKDARLFAVLDAATQRRHGGLARQAKLPTLENIERAANELRAQMKADKTRGDEPILYFSFSGHSSRTPRAEPFLALRGGGLTRQVLYEQILESMPFEYAHLIIDACDAGAVVGVRGLFGNESDARVTRVTQEEARSISSAELVAHPSIGALVSSSQGEEAFEWSRIESGVFTHELISGLYGAADVNGDRVIEYSEAHAFISSANREIGDPRASPSVIAWAPRRNRSAPLVHLDALRGTRLLVGDPSAMGRFSVELENGERHVEAHLGDVAALGIALPAGQAAFVRTRWSEAKIQPGWGPVAISQLRFEPITTAQRGSVDEALRSALFASPYGITYYKGFVDSRGENGVSLFPTLVPPLTPSPAVRPAKPATPPPLPPPPPPAKAPSGSAAPVSPAKPQAQAPAPASAVAAQADDKNRKVSAFALFGLTAVSAIAAGVCGATALKKKADFDDEPYKDEAHGLNKSYQSLGTAAITLGVVGALAGISAIIVWPKNHGKSAGSAKKANFAIEPAAAL